MRECGWAGAKDRVWIADGPALEGAMGGRWRARWAGTGRAQWADAGGHDGLTLEGETCGHAGAAGPGAAGAAGEVRREPGWSDGRENARWVG